MGGMRGTDSWAARAVDRRAQQGVLRLGKLVVRLVVERMREVVADQRCGDLEHRAGLRIRTRIQFRRHRMVLVAADRVNHQTRQA